MKSANESSINKILKTKNCPSVSPDEPFGREWRSRAGTYKIKHISSEYKHVLTHQIIYARFISLEMNKKFRAEKNWISKPIHDHDEFAFPVLIQKYFDNREAGKV